MLKSAKSNMLGVQMLDRTERDNLIRELANVAYNGKQSDDLRDGAKQWLWDNIERIREELSK